MLQLPENKRDLYGKNKLNHSATVFHTDPFTSRVQIQYEIKASETRVMKTSKDKIIVASFSILFLLFSALHCLASFWRDGQSKFLPLSSERLLLFALPLEFSS